MRRKVTTLPALAQPRPHPANLDFTQGETGTVPASWFAPTARLGYKAEIRREGCRSANSACAAIINPADPPPNSFGNLMQTFDAAAYRGKTVRLRAWIKAEGPARAQMWLRVDRPNRQMGLFDNVDDRPVTTAEWKECEISGTVDDDALAINIGVMAIGKGGGAWVEGVRFEAEDANPPTSDETALRKQIEALYQRMDETLAKGDIDALAAFAAPDGISDFGFAKRPLPEIYAELKRQYASGARFTSVHKITSLKLAGDLATVTTRSEDSIKSASGVESYEGAGRDTWVRTPQGWRLKTTTTLSQRAVVPPTDADAAKAVAAQIRQRATPIKTPKAGSGFADLEAFGKAIGDARIVALGEATHGTKEFFQMKHRVLEYLVREKGFTVFAIEANWPEALVADRYIKTGEGDVRKALSAMYFWTWNTREVADMIE